MAETRPPKSRLDAWESLVVAHAVITRQLERELAEERGLSLGWYDVLYQLSKARGRLRMQDLAARLVMPRSSLTRQIDSMQVARLVTREFDADDGRAVWAVLTPEGRATLRRAAPVHLRGVDQHFASKLDGQDVAALRRVMAKLTE